MEVAVVADDLHHAGRERAAELECDLGQGYYFAKPLDKAALQELLDGSTPEGERAIAI